MRRHSAAPPWPRRLGSGMLFLLALLRCHCQTNVPSLCCSLQSRLHSTSYSQSNPIYFSFYSARGQAKEDSSHSSEWISAFCARYVGHGATADENRMVGRKPASRKANFHFLRTFFLTPSSMSSIAFFVQPVVQEAKHTRKAGQAQPYLWHAETTCSYNLRYPINSA